MHDVAGSFKNALNPQCVAPGEHTEIRAAQRMRNRGRGVEIEAFQQIRIVCCRPQCPAVMAADVLAPCASAIYALPRSRIVSRWAMIAM